MNQDDLYCSRGPVSTMPGSTSPVPEGTMCDTHEDRPAVKRVQGETDSFGCEYVCVCQECLDGMHKYRADQLKVERLCHWCKKLKLGVRPHRDMDEGMCGPLYDVCSDCITAENEAAAAQMAEFQNHEEPYLDYLDPDEE